MSLDVKKLQVEVEGTEILHGISLQVPEGALHVVMGPNGSGKSTLAHATAGHPSYAITGGKILLNKEDITEASPDERARAGLFLSFQYPVEVPGVSVQQFIRTSYNATHKTNLDPLEFSRTLKVHMKDLQIDSSLAKRSLNEGFSGGEKKRMEMLQLSMLEPRFAILDETDSGLDVDAIKLVAQTVEQATRKGTGVLLITHYSRILKYLKPDAVHILANGNIIHSGDANLAEEIETNGYESYVSRS